MKSAHTETEIGKLLGYYAGEYGANHAANNRFLGHSARKEVDIFEVLVGDAKSADSVVIHDGKKLAPVVNRSQTAGFTPNDVRRDAVVACSLDVECH